ncbi:hypothetical protein PIB30_050287 [Stylosanthes scabra]|uniref:Uncharacterized protein n=1 Tax=Stylosanthes scabra TaxID=79078 RepID=A0ABU6WFM7_9FABA|nr:hypothetical protein [Stylosanthes scabra]
MRFFLLQCLHHCTGYHFFSDNSISNLTSTGSSRHHSSESRLSFISARATSSASSSSSRINLWRPHVHIFLLYEFVNGANLSHCLRNKINAHFMMLSTWLSSMKVATDIVDNPDYIHKKIELSTKSSHHRTATVHLSPPLII